MNHAAAQEPEQIQFSASESVFRQDIADGAYRLINNVKFTHEGTVMFCDSAYYYASSNSLDAYSRVHIIQGDSVDLTGEFLHYDGNTRIAQVRRNVRLLGKNTELTTSILDFDLGSSIGYYTNYADIISGENSLSSKRGYYYSHQQMYYFRDSVVLVNPEYTIYSDTLQYHTPTSVAYFFGPTEIIGDSSYIYCENGWYNTETNISELKKNALVQNDHQTISGDSLYYERETGYGEGYSNIEIIDDEQDIILKGNRAIVHQQEDRALITDSAQFIYITSDDSVFVHADTLRVIPDSGDKRLLRAYYGVKLYKSDLQGMCDSLSYSTTDSILKLYDQPVLWSDVNQLTADYMEIWTKNKKIDQLHMIQEAFIINQADTGMFNQIKSKNMVWYFRDNNPYRIDAKGNGQSVYYSKEDETMMVNVAECSDLKILLKEKKIDKITMYVLPKAVLYPLSMAPEDELRLKNFKWLESSRPENREDIF